MRKKLFYYLTFISLLFMAVSCEKESGTAIQENAVQSPISFITFEDFTKKVKKGSKFDKIIPHFDYNINKTDGLTQKDDIDNAVILTEQVVAVEGDDINTYTFNLSTGQQSLAFYNLVMETDKEGEILGSRILQYVPDENWLSDMSQSFSGNVGIVKNNAFDVIENNGLTANGDQCVVFRLHFCDYGGTEHPQGAFCTGNISFIDVTLCPVAPLDPTGGGPIDPTGTPVEGGSDGPVIGGGGGSGTMPIVNPCGGSTNGGAGIGGQNGECYSPPSPTPVNAGDQFNGYLEGLRQNGIINSWSEASVSSNVQSVDDINDFLNKITSLPIGVDSFDEIIQDGTVIDRVVLRNILGIPSNRIRIKTEPISDTNSTFRLLEDSVELIGLQPGYSLEKTEESIVEMVDNGELARIEIRADLTWEFKILGFGGRIVTIPKLFILTVNPFNGQVLDTRVSNFNTD